MAERYPISATDSEPRTLIEIWKEASDMENIHEDSIKEMYTAEIKYLEQKIGDIETGMLDQATIVKKKAEELKTFSQVILHKPICVCISEKDNIVFISLSGNSSIAMLELSNGSIICNITSSQLKSPWGLAIKDDIIYVTDIENIGVKAFSILQRTQKKGLNNKTDIVRPRQLAINSANEIWVADDLGNKIVILDEKLRQIGTIIDDKIKLPMDIKFAYSQAYILSRDEECVTVHMFDQDNRKNLTSTICIQSTKDNLIQSYFFKIISNIILIPNYHTKSILVYDLSGKKIHEFKTMVSATPLSLDVCRDKIYILYPKLPKMQLKIF